MPPRASISWAAACCRQPLARPSTIPAAQTSLASLFAGLSIQNPFALPAPSGQTRSSSILSNLSDNPSAYHKRIRRGRGPSSGYGKTAGRGNKGQGQHGKVKPWFQGGQTPLIVKKGKKGFDNIRRDVMSEINIDRLQQWIEAGRIDPTKPITPKEIIQSGLVGRVQDGIKLLGKGKSEMRIPVDIVVSRASAGAIDAVERAGGTITTRYYTKKALHNLLEGKSQHTAAPLPTGPEHVEGVLAKVRQQGYFYRLPDPTSRWDIEYYRDPAHRGYLSHTLQKGESPSLYFKVPMDRKAPRVEKTDAQGRKIVDDEKLF